jgi:putative FmdB family regulatory protein
MPIYEYRCQDCGKGHEILLRRREERVACPACGSKKLTRLFSTFAAHAGASPCPAADACPSGGSCHGGDCPLA